VKRTGKMAFAAALLLGQASFADVTLVDKDDWKVSMYGFIETDVIHDSTRSFSEVIGNAPVQPAGTVTGDNAWTQYSNRNTRLGFKIQAPEENGWRTKGLLEMDFLGFDPGVSTNPISGTTTNDTTVPNSESSFYQNPTPRIRHAWGALESDNWKFLFGQTWSTFGWQADYVPTSVSVAPLPGNLYQRTAQIQALNTIKWSNSNFQWLMALERPSQRDSQTPNFNLAVKYAIDSWKAGFATYYGEEKAVPASLALSSTFKQFQAFNPANGTTGYSKVNSSAFAADILFPIIPASDGDTSNALTFSAEYSSGTGYGDALPSWTGGFKQLPQGTTSAMLANTNLDAGQAYFDNNGNFGLLQLQTYLVSLQYHFPKSWGAFLVAGYSQLQSTTINSNISATSGGTPLNSFGNLYNTESNYYLSYFQNLSKQLRLGLEWDHTTTQYVNTNLGSPSNDRIQFSTWITI